jgi:hypothetical protein
MFASKRDVFTYEVDWAPFREHIRLMYLRADWRVSVEEIVAGLRLRGFIITYRIPCIIVPLRTPSDT